MVLELLVVPLLLLLLVLAPAGAPGCGSCCGLWWLLVLLLLVLRLVLLLGLRPLLRLLVLLLLWTRAPCQQENPRSSPVPVSAWCKAASEDTPKTRSHYYPSSVKLAPQLANHSGKAAGERVPSTLYIYIYIDMRKLYLC
jgi:hypothetical protein